MTISHPCPICRHPVLQGNITCSVACGIRWGWVVRRRRERQRVAMMRFARGRVVYGTTTV
jgi:predicted nucleic acid-binding Zn ribbon protein